MSAAGSPPGGRLLCAFLVLSAPDQRISFPVYQSDDSLGENSNEKYVSWIAYFIPFPLRSAEQGGRGTLSTRLRNLTRLECIEARFRLFHNIVARKNSMSYNLSRAS